MIDSVDGHLLSLLQADGRLSNAELARRNPADRGREYSDVAGDWTVPWGQA